MFSATLFFRSRWQHPSSQGNVSSPKMRNISVFLCHTYLQKSLANVSSQGNGPSPKVNQYFCQFKVEGRASQQTVLQRYSIVTWRCFIKDRSNSSILTTFFHKRAVRIIINRVKIDNPITQNLFSNTFPLIMIKNIIIYLHLISAFLFNFVVYLASLMETFHC